MLYVSDAWLEAVRSPIRPAAHLKVLLDREPKAVPTGFLTSELEIFVASDGDIFQVYDEITTVLFEDADIISATQSWYCSPIMSQLPSYTFTCVLHNKDNMFNPENPTGLVGSLLTNKKIKVTWGFDLPTGTEWLDAGVYYLSQWDIDPENLSATISGIFILDLAISEYTNGIYNTSGTTYYDLLNSVLNFSGINNYTATENKPWTIPNDFKNYSTMIPLHTDPCNSLIQTLVGGTRHVIFPDPITGDIVFQRPTFVQNVYGISKNILLSKTAITLDTELKDCYANTYRTQVATDVTTIYEEEMSVAGSYVFDSISSTPYTNYTLTVTSDDGVTGSMTFQGAYKVSITLTGTGTASVVLTGKKIEFSSIPITTYSNPTGTGEDCIIDNAYISNVFDAEELSDYTANILQYRQRLSADFSGDPAIQPLDVIEIATDFGNVPIIVTKVVTEFDGGWSGTIEGIQTIYEGGLPGRDPITGTFYLEDNRTTQVMSRERSES